MARTCRCRQSQNQASLMRSLALYHNINIVSILSRRIATSDHMYRCSCADVHYSFFYTLRQILPTVSILSSVSLRHRDRYRSLPRPRSYRRKKTPSATALWCDRSSFQHRYCKSFMSSSSRRLLI